MKYKVTLAQYVEKRTITLGDGEYLITQGQIVEGDIFDKLAKVYPSIFSEAGKSEAVLTEIVKVQEPKEELLVEAPVEVKVEVEIEVPETPEVKPEPKKKAPAKKAVKATPKKAAKKDSKED